MLKGINTLNPHIRYATLANIYGMGAYLIVSLLTEIVFVSQNWVSSLNYWELIYGLVAAIYGMFFINALYGFISVLIFSVGFTIIFEAKHCLKYILTNLVASVIFFPGAVILLSIVVAVVYPAVLSLPLMLLVRFCGSC